LDGATIGGYAIKMLDEPAPMMCPIEDVEGEGIGGVTASLYKTVAIHHPELI